MVKPIQGPAIEDQSEPTETEKKINEAEKHITKHVTHIDGKAALLQYVFPFLRMLAKTSGDQEEQIADLDEALADIGKAVSTNATTQAEEMVGLFEDIAKAFVKLGQGWDKTMVRAGFYKVTPQGLQPTKSCSDEQRIEYEEAAEMVTDILADINETVQDLRAEGAAEGPNLEGAANLDDAAEASEVANAALASAAADVNAPPLAETSEAPRAEEGPNGAA